MCVYKSYILLFALCNDCNAIILCCKFNALLGYVNYFMFYVRVSFEYTYVFMLPVCVFLVIPASHKGEMSDLFISYLSAFY